MNAASTNPGPRYEALLQLLRTAETLWNASRTFFARWDLGPSQFNILNLLYRQPEGLTQTELGRALIMHRSNVTGLVDRLEARGLVQRKTSPDDRRIYRVIVSPAGRELLQEILPHYYDTSEKVWGDISVKRAEQIVAELRRISANAEEIANRSNS